MSEEQLERISRIEWRLDEHDEELKELKDTSKDLRTSLEEIRKTLFQIKWIAIGGGLVFIADNIGIMQALKMGMGVM
jgi:diaminopimelate decarboxylase